MVPELTGREYDPDFAVAPGETLRETLEVLGMSQKELATRTGLTEQSINRIIQGRQPITPDTSNKLELTTGVPARLWNNLESQYQEQLAKAKERAQMQLDLDWLKTIPHNQLVKRNVIPKERDRTVLLRNVLGFFGVSSVQQYNELWKRPAVAARRSQAFESHPAPTSVWIRLGELEAQKIAAKPYNRAGFLKALYLIRRLTTKKPKQFIPEMKRMCAECGVAFCLVPELPKAPWHGASMWLSPARAMIILSLRGKREDQFWFSFFHEAVHILFDSKKDMYINNGKSDDPREKKADKIAADMLIPNERNNQIEKIRSRSDVQRLAKELGVSPGIVVGRFHHLTEKYSWFADLKRKFVWAD